jgi:transcriptional regulator with XRE-family HTH domain
MSNEDMIKKGLKSAIATHEIPMDDKTIGELFRCLREVKGFSLRDAAKLSGLSNPFICQFENGKGISLQNFIKLCDAYEIKIGVNYETR